MRERIPLAQTGLLSPLVPGTLFRVTRFPSGAALPPRPPFKSSLLWPAMLRPVRIQPALVPVALRGNALAFQARWASINLLHWPSLREMAVPLFFSKNIVCLVAHFKHKLVVFK